MDNWIMDMLLPWRGVIITSRRRAACSVNKWSRKWQYNMLQTSIVFNTIFVSSHYVPGEPQRDLSNRWLYEHRICIHQCQDSNSQPVPSQMRADSTRPQWLPVEILRPGFIVVTHHVNSSAEGRLWIRAYDSASVVWCHCRRLGYTYY